MLLHYLGKSKVQICQKKLQKILLKNRTVCGKNETLRVIWLKGYRYCHMFIIFKYARSKMTSPLVNCIVSYAAVNAMLSVHERNFNSLTLNDKLAAE